ncbi:MAG: nicotinate phosphoribosyltransferase, partial [Nitrososphaerota archaeon]
MKIFLTASDEEIKSGYTTDVYFERTEKILKEKGMDKVNVVAEVTTGGLPEGKKWGILTGVIEVAKLLEGCKVNFYSMHEGSVFRSNDYYGIREPAAFIEGPYIEFCKLETPLLGFLCQS